MDWESAYQQCPPFGVGKGPYTGETCRVMETVRQDLAALRQGLTGEKSRLLEQYLESAEQYLHSGCRYYYYRGMLHGTREALEIYLDGGILLQRGNRIGGRGHSPRRGGPCGRPPVSAP